MPRFMRNAAGSLGPVQEANVQGHNEYCKNCVWFDTYRHWCSNHKQYMKDFDWCNDFKRS